MSTLIEVREKNSIADLLSEKNIPIHNFSPHELLEIEKDILGIYVHGHPLTMYRKELTGRKKAGYLTIQSHHVEQLGAGQPVLVAGLLVQVRRQFTVNKQVMAFLLLEDERGFFEAIAFPETFKYYFSLLVKDSLLVIKGKMGNKNGEEKIVVQEIIKLHSYLQENKL